MAVVCLSAWLTVRLYDRYAFSSDCDSAKSIRNFTKPSAYVKFGLPSCFKLFGPLHVPACTHSAWNRAHYFFLLFYQFWHFEAIPYWKWKNWGHTPDRSRRGAPFSFYSFFFHFSNKVLQNGCNVPKMVKQNPLFYPWWPKYASHGAILMVQTLINAVPLFGTSEFMLWEKVLKSVKKWTFWKSKFSELSWNIRPIWRWSYIPLVMLLPNKPKKDKLNLSWTHINFPLFLFLEWNWKE